MPRASPRPGYSASANPRSMMLTTPTIDAPQLASHERDGWALLPQGFGRDDMRRITSWVDEIAARPEEPGKHWVYKEQNLVDSARSQVNRIENTAPFHDGFAELAEVLRAPVAQLLGEEAVLFKEKINFKLPGGSGFEPHQDSQAGWEAYARYFVTVVVCIDPATEENGCLYVARWKRGRQLYREWEPMTEAEVNALEFIACPMSPGDVLFLGSYTPHFSKPNFSDRLRRMYFSTYNALSEGDHRAQYYADKHRNYPPDVERAADKEYVYRV